MTLCGCQPQTFPNTPTIPVLPTETSQPRWMLYERALSKAVVNQDDGLCEWEILGKSGNEVYVWAECRVMEPIGTAGSGPAVIYLGENGGIEKVTIPRDGNYNPVDIQALFPTDIQEKVFHSSFDGPAADRHIDERLKSNGPPIIVLSGTPLP